MQKFIGLLELIPTWLAAAWGNRQASRVKRVLNVSSDVALKKRRDFAIAAFFVIRSFYRRRVVQRSLGLNPKRPALDARVAAPSAIVGALKSRTL